VTGTPAWSPCAGADGPVRSPAQQVRSGAPDRGARGTPRRVGRSPHLVLSVALGLAACGGGRPGAGQNRDTPELVALDTVVLAETDSVFIGEPSGFAPLAEGGYLVADRRNGTLHRFAADGAHLASVGRRGRGPGEWSTGPFAVVNDGDSLAFVADGGAVVALSLPDLAVRWRRPPSALARLAAAWHGGALWSRIDRSANTSFETFAGAADPVVAGGPVTQRMRRNPLVAEMFSSAAAANLGGDTLVSAFQNTDSLFVGSWPSGPWTSLEVPVAARRGARGDLLDAIDEHLPPTVERALYQPSYPLAVARLPASGYVALVTGDLTFVEQRRMTGRLFVSIVDLRRRRACPDEAVPAPDDPLPRVAFRGDTLLVLVQDVNPGAGSRTVVRPFLVRAGGCRWRAAGPGARP
jgi:hypothetical protein